MTVSSVAGCINDGRPTESLFDYYDLNWFKKPEIYINICKYNKYMRKRIMYICKIYLRCVNIYEVVRRVKLNKKNRYNMFVD